MASRSPSDTASGSGMPFGPGESELTSLKSVEDDAILANTKERYEAGHIYTRSGRLLLAVNPYRQLPLYTAEVLEAYKLSLQPQAELPPHVYAVAASAHLGMLRDSRSQSVIISGESGAGKTETAKILLQFLAATSSNAGGDLHRGILQTNPIMENFGNARTVWNNNSSRFGKFLTLQFSASGRMQGAFMRTYLLEKSRITSQLPGEQNYHILYQVARGLTPETRAAHALGEWHSNAYLNVRNPKDVVWEDFPTTFDEVDKALRAIPTITPHVDAVWSVLCAVLHLGNARFVGAGDDDAQFDQGGSIGQAARLLGCVPEQLTKALCTLNIKAGLDWIAKPNTTRYAQSAKDALSKALYSRLFDSLVERINASLMCSGDEIRYFIGAVDIFGFECFPHNSLEQLCINFANEKLQRMFTEAVFESVLAEYTKEGIEVGEMVFEDNSEVVALIEGSPGGLLTALSEECFFPNGSDIGWLEKIKEKHKKHPRFEQHVKESKTSFAVHHYPGKVVYDAVGFLDKNKDPLSQDVKVLMQYSDTDFVQSLFADKPTTKGGRSQFKSAKFVGVIDTFRTSLSELVSTLQSTKTHFIRCVKPNEKKAPKSYVDDVMQRQLYRSGVVQAVRATRQGFPDHLPFDDLLRMYALIVDKAAASSSGRAGVASMLKTAKVPEGKYRLGKTKVFLGVGVLDALEQARMEFLARKAVSMQLVARVFLARRRLQLLREEAARKKREEEERKRKEEEERLRREEEERKAREEEERKAKEEEQKRKEAEEKERQERFRRARQLSFERKTAKKKREEAEKKKREQEAAAAAAAEKEREEMEGSVDKARASFGMSDLERKSQMERQAGLTEGADDDFASKLQSFQQEVHDGTVTDSEMINVAVVSDIGWKTGQEPTTEDVWAQYDFKCAVSDVLEYAEYLGMDIKEDAHLLWIADEALQAPEPQGWEQRLDPKGGVYYYHPTTGMSLNQHPLDHHYQQFYLQMKAQYDAMYTNAGARPQGVGAAAPVTPTPATGGDSGNTQPSKPPVDISDASTPQSGIPSGSAPQQPPDSGSSVPGSATKKKSLLRRLSSATLGGRKKDAGPVEEMYQLSVDLVRQQDGLGIGLTLDNIIVEVEPGGSVAAQGELQYGDQIVQVDGVPLTGRMLKDVIVPRKMHQLVVRYTRVSTQQASPRRQRSRRIEAEPGVAPRRIEESELQIMREAGTGRLGFGIDQMNTVVNVDSRGPVAGKLQVGDKIIAVDGEQLNLRKFAEVVGPSETLRLQIARLRVAAQASTPSKSKRELLFNSMRPTRRRKKRLTQVPATAAAANAAAAHVAAHAAASEAAAMQAREEARASSNESAMPALREVRLVKESEDTKIGAVFHRLDDAFDKSFFNVEGSSVQPIIKKVDPESRAKEAGLVPGDIVLSVTGVSGLSNFQVVEMLRKGQGVFTLVVISGRQVQSSLVSQQQQPQQTYM
jgi:myosin-5